jgi:hypothetical protein
MAITRQLNVFLANKPGQLATLCRALAAAKVNIVAISVCDTVDHGVVRLVTDRNNAARAILKKRKIPFTDNQVLSVKMSNKPGALAAASAALAKAKVNIEYLYGSTTAAGEIATIIMRVSDAKKAAKALK